MRVRLVGVLALMALVVASCGGTPPEAEGPSEGIQVHGDWTIDIYNEDGSLDRHVAFSNDLSDIGAERIKRLLGRTHNAGEWHVELFNVFGEPCNNNDGNARSCRATEVADFQDNYFPTLVLDTSVDGVLTMSGSVTIQNDTTIDGVSTRLATCTAGATDCLNSGLAPAIFSSRHVDHDPTDGFDRTPVTAGQQVQVSVSFSFTSG